MKEFNLETFKEIVSLSKVSCCDVSKNILDFVKEKYPNKNICDIDFDNDRTYINSVTQYSNLENIKFFEVVQNYTTKKTYDIKVKTNFYNGSKEYSYSNEFKKDYKEINEVISTNHYNLDYSSKNDYYIATKISYSENRYFVAYKSLFFETTFEEYNSILKERYTELDKQSLVKYLENLKTENIKTNE